MLAALARARRHDGRGRAARLGHARRRAAQARRRRGGARRMRGGRRRARRCAASPDVLPGTAVLRDGEPVHRRADRRGDASPICPRCAGPTNGSRGTTTITIASTRSRTARAPRWRRRAAARITARFCAKIDFRDHYRRRELALLLDEIDGLIAQGVRYLYFIDEIFLPQRPLLEALARARRAVRRADAHRSVEAGDDRRCSGAPAASRSRRASRA